MAGRFVVRNGGKIFGVGPFAGSREEITGAVDGRFAPCVNIL
jgi:hypothetical protein